MSGAAFVSRRIGAHSLARLFSQLFMPVSPKTTYDELINDVLAGLATSAHTPPAETGASSFKDMGPSDVGLFEGSKTVGTADGQQDESIRFVQVDREQPTLEEMGIVDGPDAIVYLGFRDASKGESPHFFALLLPRCPGG